MPRKRQAEIFFGGEDTIWSVMQPGMKVNVHWAGAGREWHDLVYLRRIDAGTKPSAYVASLYGNPDSVPQLENASRVHRAVFYVGDDHFIVVPMTDHFQFAVYVP